VLSNAYVKLGMTKEAMKPAASHSKKPDDLMAYYNLGVTYLAIGDKESAMTPYKIM